MLGAGELLDAAVSAVVVGENQTLAGNHLSGTSAAENHDSVLQGRVVDVVDLFCCELAAVLLHGLDVHLLKKRQQPHSFVCRC